MTPAMPATVSPAKAKTSVEVGRILPVRKVSKDGGDYVVKCPHCKDIIGIGGDDLSEIRGEQFQHRKREYPGPNGPKSNGCDGWLEVSTDAVYVRELCARWMTATANKESNHE